MIIARNDRIDRPSPQPIQDRHLLVARAQVLRELMEVTLGGRDLRLPKHHREPNDVAALTQVVGGKVWRRRSILAGPPGAPAVRSGEGLLRVDAAHRNECRARPAAIRRA
jgi:hypothetical protein